jgi:hypothetical protein
MRILEANRLDRRAALALLAGAGILTDLPALACYTERRKRCEVLIAEPGLPSARAGNPAIDFGVRTMRDSLPDKQAAPAPVVLGETPDQSADLLQAALERLDPLAAIVADYTVAVERLRALADKFGTPMLALLAAEGEKKASCLFYLIPNDDLIAGDCIEILRAAGFASGVIGIAFADWESVADAIVVKLEKMGAKGLMRVGGVGASAEDLSTQIAERSEPSAWMCVVPRFKALQLARLLPRNKNILLVSPVANPGQVLHGDAPPNWLLASFISPPRLAVHPVGKILAASEQGRNQPDPTYLVDATLAATAWQALAMALVQAGIDKADNETVEQEKICKAIAALHINASELLLPWDHLSFNPVTNGVEGARVVGLARRKESISQIWPETG